MAKIATNKTHIRKLTRTGGGKSISVTLPIEHIRDLGWKDRQKIVIKRSGNKFIIKDWKK